VIDRVPEWIGKRFAAGAANSSAPAAPTVPASLPTVKLRLEDARCLPMILLRFGGCPEYSVRFLYLPGV
jgi:hypothetical protein